MIYVLHGDDTLASYQRLTEILATYHSFPKVRLTNQNSSEEFYMALFSTDLFDPKKIVICENLLATALKGGNLRKAPEEKQIIFWEHSQLTTAVVNQVKNLAKIELFKPKPEIFWFLDSINPDPTKSLVLLAKLKLEEQALVWHMNNRVLLLILAKLGGTVGLAAKITQRKIDDWQWRIILTQAKLFSLVQLRMLYNGILKLDFMIKRGQTSLNPKTLISVLLLKYLRG